MGLHLDYVRFPSPAPPPDADRLRAHVIERVGHEGALESLGVLPSDPRTVEVRTCLGPYERPAVLKALADLGGQVVDSQGRPIEPDFPWHADRPWRSIPLLRRAGVVARWWSKIIKRELRKP